jgi:Putative peptidoglycan binding domain
MKTLILILATIAMAAPTSFAKHKITYYSDRDGDGHYVKRSAKLPHVYRGSHYGKRHYSYPRHGRSCYGSHYYRPVTVYPHYRSGYYRSRPGITFNYRSSPRYSRSYDYDSSQEVDVQRELKRRGYYYGDVDGDIGPETRSAIRAFQSDQGLYPSGRIDSRLLRELNL